MDSIEKQLLVGGPRQTKGNIYRDIKKFIKHNGRYPATDHGSFFLPGEKILGQTMNAIRSSKATLWPREIQLFELLPNWSWSQPGSIITSTSNPVIIPTVIFPPMHIRANENRENYTR